MQTNKLNIVSTLIAGAFFSLSVAVAEPVNNNPTPQDTTHHQGSKARRAANKTTHVAGEGAKKVVHGAKKVGKKVASTTKKGAQKIDKKIDKDQSVD